METLNTVLTYAWRHGIIADVPFCPLFRCQSVAEFKARHRHETYQWSLGSLRGGGHGRGRHLCRAAWGAYLFGAIRRLPLDLQGVTALPLFRNPNLGYFLDMAPYLFTIIVLVLASSGRWAASASRWASSTRRPTAASSR